MRAQKVYNRGVFGVKSPQTQRYKKFSTQVHRLRASVVDPEKYSSLSLYYQNRILCTSAFMTSHARVARESCGRGSVAFLVLCVGGVGLLPLWARAVFDAPHETEV